MSKYQKQFEEALQFGTDLFGADAISNKSANRFASTLMKDDQLNATIHQFIISLIEHFLLDRAKLVGGSPSFKCHVVSQQFKEFADNWKVSERASSIADLRLTVGNVFYKGNNIYQLNKKKLKTIINDGQTLSKSLDLHVWLTASDMTVYDLSIIPTLRELGYDMESYEIFDFKVWSSGDKKDFDYVPLLVDDKFSHRVDIFS
ncbi:hypothetical protein R7D97_25505 [Vibrio sp. Vb5031]|uniref:Uncharacterized protein n=1 Tax=Vibrio hepatarius TaxID=171383 RepID=A0A0M0HSZ5_9VIBR|nr:MULTISPECIES: hypothetical protein [Vibrio]KOO05196.1 hypothetical protein AKJ31_21575 [Vibrio hepatarius]MCR9817918.1 hypothetical protein [Vibrio parahaemolyticus]MDW1507545.1 hypothetical protein [Vibrio sp. Vb5031]MDW2456403.1 hypothetical protein [Vibrio sp. 1249-1]HBC3593064.1 hypothetical protein [Vibrio parahaemolyticus]